MKKEQKKKKILEEAKLKKMAKTCEQFRIKADKIFDRLQWEEGLEISDIHDLYKQFIRAKAKEFELYIFFVYILRILKKKNKK